MAAKGYGYFRSRSGVARRYSRPSIRSRMTSRSPRIVQHKESQETDSRSTGSTTRKVTFSEPSYLELPSDLGESTDCPTPAMTTADSDVNEEVDMSDVETPPSCGYRSLSLDLTDFSDHINMALDGVHSNASSLTVCDLESYTRAAPEEDLYGWEAELKRKLKSCCHSPCDGSVVCTSCLRGDTCRPAEHKRNLLQRVFSFGEGKPRTE
jgi:hypothetical protein